MENNTYRIHGQCIFIDADTEDGFLTVDIDEEISSPSAKEALSLFLDENTHYEFNGSLKMVDAGTAGGHWACFEDQNENQQITVDIVE